MEKLTLKVTGRREFLVMSGTAALSALLAGRMTGASAAAHMEGAMMKLIGDAKPMPAAGKIKFDLPEIAENGNTVPMTVKVASAMTDGDYVKKIHVLASGNPEPGVASFHLTPASGEASASIRMRLAKTQNVVALAEMSDGKVYIAKQTVKVTIGGCGG